MPSIEADNPRINPVEIDEDHLHVVAALIWDPESSQRFLIAQRQKGKHLQDYWEFPGGKLEPGEAPWRGLQRELKEEIGIWVQSGRPFIKVYYRYPDRNILLDTWLVESFLGKIEPREQQAIAWIDVTQIDSYRFPPADLPILKAIRSSGAA
jgi:8-oxo-dGTP diphosphatase